jgi:hypothetical protein
MRVLFLNVYFYIPYSFNQPLLSGERIWWRISRNELRLMSGRLSNEKDDVGGVGGTYRRSGIACMIFGPEICREGTICKLGIAGNILKWILQEDRRSWDSVVIVVTKLRAGRSRVRIPAAERDFFLLRNTQGGSGAHPVSISIGTEVTFRAYSDWSVEFTTQPHLVSRLRIRGAMPLIPLHDFLGWTGASSPVLK